MIDLLPERAGALDAVRHGRAWFAVRTRARHEKKVRDRLLSRGVDLLLPLIVKRQRWSDRIKSVEMPLFSCYCFVQIATHEYRTVLEAPGVVGLVGTGNRPQPIPELEITALQQLSASKLPYEPHPYLEQGAMVEIVRGPLTGVRGRLVHRERHAQLILAVNLIQQAAAVHIDAADVEPVQPVNA
jgi:transcription termination/antitermination protein NusG